MDTSSMISVLSTEHGRLRREQRDIRKRDVAKAIRYGTRERAWGRRWKIEHDNITFIVNEFMTEEVTAYPSPLALAPIDTRDRVSHNLANVVLTRKPELCTSHTVLVVDNSGSMTKKDILLHKNRQVAAYSVTAMDFVAEQLFQQTATNSDVVTLIEFDRNAHKVFSRESFDWILYNKLLERRDSRSYIQREGLSLRDMVNGDTNYLTALEVADQALREIAHDRCALSLFFLSDGAPTDAMALGITPDAAKHRVEAKMAEMAERYGDKLNATIVGFGASHHDFSVLEAMAGAVQSTDSGAKADFVYCDKAANKIESAIRSLVSSTTMTRTQLLTGDRNRNRTRRTVQLESSEASGQHQWNYFRIQGHLVFDTRLEEFVPTSDLPPGAVFGAGEGFGRDILNELQRTPPPFLGINRVAFGVGAERIAFRCQLAVQESEQSFVLNTMVAKETNLVERPDDNVEFHKNFCEAQDLASYLAREFNKRLVGLPWYDAEKTQQIAFLPCSILILDDPEWSGRGVLVEKKLDVEKYGWHKYNDNAGVRVMFYDVHVYTLYP
jgi:Mg-chelatase subunit ChlD